MDSDDEIGIDSGNVSSDEDYDFMQVDEIQRTSGQEVRDAEYPYEVLTTEEIVQHMLDCIAEVNNVVEVSEILNSVKKKREIGSNLLLLRQ
jgi:ariadne-1